MIISLTKAIYVFVHLGVMGSGFAIVPLAHETQEATNRPSEMTIDLL